jgi:hypothetical protein
MHHFPFSYIKPKILEQFLFTYNYNLICSCTHTIVHIIWYFGNHSSGFLINLQCSTFRISPYLPPDCFLLNNFHNLPHFPRPQISNLSAVTHFLLLRTSLKSPAYVTFYLQYSAGLAFPLKQLMKNNLTLLTFILCHLFNINHLLCVVVACCEKQCSFSLSLTLSSFNSVPLPLCAFYLTTPKSSLPHMASSVFWTWLCTLTFFLHNHVCNYLNIALSYTTVY